MDGPPASLSMPSLREAKWTRVRQVSSEIRYQAAGLDEEQTNDYLGRYKKPAFSRVDRLQEYGVRPSSNAEFCQFPEPVEALKRRHVYLDYPRP